MIPLPPAILYTRDGELAGRLERITRSTVELQVVSDFPVLEEHLEQAGDAVIIADIRAVSSVDTLRSINSGRPLSVLIIMGVPFSDPMLLAETVDPYALIALDIERRALQALLRQAGECLKLRQKSDQLQDEVTKLNAQLNAPVPEVRSPLSAPFQNFSKAQRNFDNVEKLLESVIDGLVDSARVSRAGIFTKPDGTDLYSYQAGTRCLQTTLQQTYASSHPFVSWMQTQLHLVSRQTLENIHDPDERALLKQTLDNMGAEIILPLHAGGSLLGWILVGRPATGIPFDIAGLEDLIGLANHISTTLEKALQYEETALQKALAGTVLHSIPFGIIACDEKATIRWFNSTAREILEPDEGQLLGEPIDILGSQMADIFREYLNSDDPVFGKEWDDPRTRRTLSADLHGLRDGDVRVGSMMILHDISNAKLLKEKEEQLERAAFWTDLAASMSHEIRNPLVAIKTFSQLLPDRYEDPDFRAEFGEQVTAEVDRLNHIIDKINRFADHHELVFKPLDIRRPIETAVTRLQSELDHDNLRIYLAADDLGHNINGDAESLEECFYHLLRNAAENLGNKDGASIKLSVKRSSMSPQQDKILVIITDNGSGIDDSVRDKLFSPFSTIKARGLGLGLPIAKRSVIDHNGQLDIESNERGTSLRISIPALDKE